MCAPMRARIFQLDAFTTRRFAGNPAGVVLLDAFPDDAVMQAIAAENNLAETAFLVPDRDDYRLRWFTPLTEVPLCGHATLASAAVVLERLEPERRAVVFHSASGPLTVCRASAGYLMDFPSRPSERVKVPRSLGAALGAEPVEVVANEHNYLALLDGPEVVRALAPDFAAISGLDRTGVIVTARRTVAEQLRRPEVAELLSDLPPGLPHKIARPDGDPSTWPAIGPAARAA